MSIAIDDDLDVDHAKQGTPEWYAARAGLATGSCFIDIIGETKPDKAGKTRPLKARENYLWHVTTEIVNGVALEGASSYSMQWGTDVEPFAREAYEIHTGYDVEQVGFVTRKSMPGIGVSVDGMVGEDGNVEIKCPKDSIVHMMTWYNGMPEEHLPQVQGGLWVTGRKWCDFISYDPRATPAMRLYVQRIYRDEPYIQALSIKVAVFLAEVEVMVQKLRSKVAA